MATQDDPRLGAPPTLGLRRAKSHDVDLIRRLVDSCYQQYVFGDGTKPAPMNADYEDLVRSGETWVVELDADLIGVVVFEVRPDHLLLENIAVRRDFRGTGVGRYLMDFVEEQALERGRTEVRLYTGELMTQNRHYYPQRGYVETHREMMNGRVAVWYTKSLGPTR